MGKADGHSAYARMQLTGGSPVARKACAPIFAWAYSVFEGTMDERILIGVWKQANIQLGIGGRPRDRLRGAGGAAYLALRRIGWTMPRHDVVLMRDGHSLNLRTESPLVVRQLAEEDFNRWEAGRSTLAQKLGQPPQLDGLQAAMKAKYVPAACKDSVRALVEQGWPTQASLYQGGRASHDHCLQCPGVSNQLQYTLVLICCK